MVKKVRTPGGFMVPARYVSGLTGEERRKRLLQLERMRERGRLLGPLAGDKTASGKKRKPPKSKYAKLYEKRYGRNQS